MKKSIFIIIFIFNYISVHAQCSLNWSIYTDLNFDLALYLKLTGDKYGNVYQSAVYNTYQGDYGRFNINKYDPEGNLLWTFSDKKHYEKYLSGFKDGSKVLTDLEGNTYLAGPFYNDTEGVLGYYLNKIDNEGKLSWVKKEQEIGFYYFKNIFFDNNQDILLITKDSVGNTKISKTNKDGSLGWEYFFKEGIYDLTFDSKNHIHILLEDQVVELIDGVQFKKISVPSIVLNDSTSTVTDAKIKVIEKGSINNYLIFANGQFNHFKLIKINEIGDTIFIKKNLNSVIEDIGPKAYLEILPNEDILYGRSPESTYVEGSVFTNYNSLAFYVINSNGDFKYKKNLYFYPSFNDLIIVDSIIFTAGTGKEYTGQVDVHNYHGVRICDPIIFQTGIQISSLYTSKGSEFYLGSFTSSPSPNQLILQKYNVNNVTTHEPGHSHVLLSPNPSTHSIIINGLDEGLEYNYSILNIVGSKIAKGFLSNENAINIEDYCSGIYFITIENGNDRQVLKFVKQ